METTTIRVLLCKDDENGEEIPENKSTWEDLELPTDEVERYLTELEADEDAHGWFCDLISDTTSQLVWDYIVTPYSVATPKVVIQGE